MNNIKTIQDIQNKVKEGYTNWEGFSDNRVKVRETEELLLFTYTNKSQYVDEWLPFELLSRGLVLEKVTGNIVSRPFDKFFNWKEGITCTDSKPKYIYEKVDGSLIAVSRYRGNLLVTTKGSFDSDQAIWAKGWLDSKCSTVIKEGKTYLFEAVYPENRIVIDYGEEEELILLAIRDNLTGDYSSLGDLQEFALGLCVRMAKIFDCFNSVGSILENLSGLTSDEEGYVVEFESGERFKFKGEEYLRIHRIISLTSPKRILEYILPVEDREALDTIYDIIPENLKEKANEWEKEIRGEADTYMIVGDSWYESIPDELHDNRKEFALYVKEYVPKEYQAFAFNRLTGKEINTLTYKHIKRKLKDESLILE